MIDGTSPDTFYSDSTYKYYSVKGSNVYESLLSKTLKIKNAECELDVAKFEPESYPYVQSRCSIGRVKIIITGEKSDINKANLQIADAYSGQKIS